MPAPLNIILIIIIGIIAFAFYATIGSTLVVVYENYTGDTFTIFAAIILIVFWPVFFLIFLPIKAIITFPIKLYLKMLHAINVGIYRDYRAKKKKEEVK